MPPSERGIGWVTLRPVTWRSPPIDVDALVRPVLVPVTIGLAVIVVVLVGIAVVQGRRIARLGRRLDGLARGADGRTLEAVLAANLDQAERVGREVDQLVTRSAAVESDLKTALQRVGMVRFNPFEETGGNQSFALAVLDPQGNGFVMSSLHARSGTRIYGKALWAGRAETALSIEETEAVRLALASPRRSQG